MSVNKQLVNKADHYNDPQHNYPQYWEGRDYEHAAEVLALKRLLHGKRFKHALDVGGGYGRLCVVLDAYADRVTLADPSRKQLEFARDFLKDHPQIECRLLQADNLKVQSGSIDLLTMIRVLHHLPAPIAEFFEIARVLSDDGCVVIEVANYTHALNRLKHLFKIKSLPITPVDIRSAENRRADEMPFVNHNPVTVIEQLSHAGLRVERTLSVSNLRSAALKKLMPLRIMLALEKPMQQMFAASYFGPSIFFLAKKCWAGSKRVGLVDPMSRTVFPRI
jgi:SAM-dependent methyltransferase